MTVPRLPDFCQSKYSCNCPLCNSVRMIFPLFDTCNRCYFLELYCSSRNGFRDQSYQKLRQEIRRGIALCRHVAGDKQMGRGREHQLLPQTTVLLKKGKIRIFFLELTTPSFQFLSTSVPTYKMVPHCVRYFMY